MNRHIEKLLSISSASISADSVENLKTIFRDDCTILQDFMSVLRAKNGFYAFESALHVFPARNSAKEFGSDEWNCPDLWIGEYCGLADNLFFFAQNIFGDQFCFNEEAVYRFDPETAELEEMGKDLDAWASAILIDYERLTGFPIAHDWQQKHGPLPNGCRLMPRIPFVLGGRIECQNLDLTPTVEGLRFRGHLATQIKDLPDGAEIQFEIEP